MKTTVNNLHFYWLHGSSWRNQEATDSYSLIVCRRTKNRVQKCSSGASIYKNHKIFFRNCFKLLTSLQNMLEIKPNFACWTFECKHVVLNLPLWPCSCAGKPGFVRGAEFQREVDQLFYRERKTLCIQATVTMVTYCRRGEVSPCHVYLKHSQATARSHDWDNSFNSSISSFMLLTLSVPESLIPFVKSS